ncbi:MAG: AMP-binding protein [Flavobacteriaceae bacterium]|nr:AMP-binding protein [Flavobacteriaceae bacterium]
MLEFKSPLEAFLYWETKQADKIFLNQPIDRKQVSYTYREAGLESRKIARYLKELKLPEKSKVAILSKNCAHWIMADLAIMMAGCVSVPIYPTLNADTIAYILNHSEAKAIIIGKLDNYAAQKEAIKNIPKIGISLYGIQEENSWETIVNTTIALKDIAVLKGEDLMTIIYTSGTTGVPKGVMHKVSSFAQVARTGVAIIALPDYPRLFSYLPLSHIAERVGIEMQGLFRGASFTFPESLETFAADLEKVQPHVFFAVPRIYAKFKEKILESIPQRKLDFILSIPILKSYFKNKLKKKLGLRKAHIIFSGAAPLAVSLMEWYQKLGITIYQAYGMTEDCALSHFNLPNNNIFGSVGKPLLGVTGKLNEVGEICIKSNCLMLGYYKMPDETQASFDSEGFLKTGDIGEYNHDYLFITGRIKDQFKTDKGKYIAPAPIELELLKNSAIEQICVVGMGIPQPIALITLSESAKKLSHSDLEKSLSKSLQHINPTLEKHEKIEKFVIMKEDWTMENGLLTPTLKTKRNQIEKIHQSKYSIWFKQKETVIYEK